MRRKVTNRKKLLTGIVCLLAAGRTYAQCTTLGQTPATAFPVCGNSVFHQDSVPLCSNGGIPTNCPVNGNNYLDLNPYYYTFTCFVSGTLGFLISPNYAGDDYDWELFDVTGQQPADIFTNKNLVVCYNWSGVYGHTGTSATANAPDQCGSTTSGPTGPTSPTPFSSMPSLKQGHQYLLMISHFLGSDQSGYALSFGGGTASITDTTLPRLKAGYEGVCGSRTLVITLNKDMRCASLAPNGSDFLLSHAGGATGALPPITSASGDFCNSGFDMSSITLNFSSPLPPGNYIVTAAKGSDGNTLLDNCNNAVPAGDSVAITVGPPPPPAPFDSLSPIGCSPSSLIVVFNKDIQCNSVAADGSDFKLTGYPGLNVTSASCGNASNTVIVQLSGPIYNAGTGQLELVTGSDGNTLIDQCSQELPPGQFISFSTGDTLLAAQINFQVHLGCKLDSIAYSGPSTRGINSWLWTFDDTGQVVGQNQEVIYNIFNEKTARLQVSNGFCSAFEEDSIYLGNMLKASFEATNLICPNDKVYFVDSSVGVTGTYNWNFGDETGDNLETPAPKQYPVISTDKNYLVQLIVSNTLGCFDTATQVIQSIANCFIAVPSAFTPNGDGINDYLYPLNAYKAAGLEFRIYNRYGQLVFQTTDWTIRWDGTVGGARAPVGTYVWTLRYTNTETGAKVVQKGTSMLIR